MQALQARIPGASATKPGKLTLQLRKGRLFLKLKVHLRGTLHTASLRDHRAGTIPLLHAQVTAEVTLRPQGRIPGVIQRLQDLTAPPLRAGAAEAR